MTTTKKDEAYRVLRAKLRRRSAAYCKGKGAVDVLLVFGARRRWDLIADFVDRTTFVLAVVDMPDSETLRAYEEHLARRTAFDGREYHLHVWKRNHRRPEIYDLASRVKQIAEGA